MNCGQDDFSLERGVRIAQLIFSRVAQVSFKVSLDGVLDNTERGGGGFGSTGTSI